MADLGASFAADRGMTYPSEVVHLHLRLPAGADCPRQVRLSIPWALAVESYTLADPSPGDLVAVNGDGQDTHISWTPDLQAGGSAREMVVATRAALNAPNGYITNWATLYGADGAPLQRLDLRIAVRRMAESLKYLPELYHRDDLTNRFLMLFESFWKPISRQIDTVHTTFDPYLAPAEFLPWLGSWFGLDLESSLPEDRQRDLVAHIAPIFPRSGTKTALLQVLRRYTGGEVEIREHVDANFVLAEGTRLGYQIALGTDNRPSSFDVRVRMSLPAGAGAESERFARQQMISRLETLIAAFKPAQTSFRLDVEFIPPSAQPGEQAES